MNINESEEEIEVTLCIKQYESGNDQILEQNLKLQTYQECYLLDKDYFNYFIKQSHVINDDINFQKVNIEFYDYKYGEFINQDDDTLGEDDEYYIFPSEFLRNEQEMKIQIFINECPQSYNEMIDIKIQQFQTLNMEKDDLLRQLDYLKTKQENIQRKNEILIINLKQGSNIDIENKQQIS